MPPPVELASGRGGQLLRFTIYHPKGNIVTADMIGDLRRAVAAIPRRGSIRLVTIEGAGADFSFGASVPEHAPVAIQQVLPDMHRLIQDVLRIPAPTAAVVRGRCLGGGFEIALACDFIFAADDAVLGLPEIGLGLFPPAGSVLLPMRVGTARAVRAVLGGDARPASQWREAGLIEFMGPASGLQAEVERWFDLRLAPRSAAALRHAAAAVRLVVRDRVDALLPELERMYLKDLMQTRDAVEGVAAFLEKRPPKWQDA
ncbi:MAG: enoyl-CoA hydratase/isomerase family protein [Acidobacteria bacterium]|nr:enoyl-CoA hydratase/isomerase family protein [Acidobacteriota bacterium]